MTINYHGNTYRIESLPNGYARVSASSGTWALITSTGAYHGLDVGFPLPVRVAACEFASVAR